MTITVFGIRHHGPGSAESLLSALENLQPDIILVEGPPEGDDLIPMLAHEEMVPPVSLLIYAPKEPAKAGFFPFAIFSPEYQSMRFALNNDIPVRFMDLPYTYMLQIRKAEEEKLEEEMKALAEKAEQDEQDGETSDENAEEADSSEQPPMPGEELDPNQPPPISMDPLGALARAAGYQDGERWWERMVELRQDSSEVFNAILEGMQTLREHEENPFPRPYDELREAYMRRIIRKVIKEGYENIAVVCGAWHAPVLTEEGMPTATHDNKVLRGLKRIKVAATWIPWTHSRLSMYSGYGAGIRSPGWYQHLWENEADIAVNWLTKVGHLLREQDLVASTAQIIDTVRMAETLATLRDLPVPGLSELNEATLTVMCNANPKPMELIWQKLIVGETMGTVPEDTPMVPLQRDFEKTKRSLRMRVQAEASTLNLDLRKPMHLDRSHFLHRLLLLGVPWGKKEDVSGKSGTFHEVWKLEWSPEMIIKLIERSVWGNTIYDAATGYANHVSEEADDLPTLTHLMREVLWSDLPEAIEPVVKRMETEAALTGDVTELMQSLPPLVDIMLYGNVRKTETAMVEALVDSIFTRVNISLPPACASLADDAAQEMFPLFMNFHSAVRSADKDEYLRQWYDTMRKMMNWDKVHGLLRGRCCRLLFDGSEIDHDEVIRQLRLATTMASKPVEVASWLEGFLRNSGLILIHDRTLLNVIDEWVLKLDEEDFVATVALLRRTFSSFSLSERKEIGRLVSRIGQEEELADDDDTALDLARADAVLGIIAELLGVYDVE